MPKTKFKPRSAVKKAAQSAPTQIGLPKAIKRLHDPNRTTFGKAKPPPRSNVVGVKLTKGKYEKIAGTRIQSLAGGVPVRIVIEDGKTFPPDRVQQVKRHMRLLEKQKKEAAAVAKMRGEDPPAAPT
mmetsp:Transcript_128390/g.256448  ORF Transcript_128390/g.256448 Transcript_128390/m.256448 type:complete len:127 (+) Transcript_128390:67-447(+)|eukprot:CAMPEP_0172813498 /NCGR_PEP_ID=MMETSP1075-20121228/10698_1 /TAXON_ID=2916 /ORGANISM="Ceratium fusus, Strain PA161109" /LENGTH=126 /DNA_ID=CAMNT_0013653205 /DNA_START=45 /DNA_END=425 /DNA_ORIENTATION=+